MFERGSGLRPAAPGRRARHGRLLRAVCLAAVAACTRPEPAPAPAPQVTSAQRTAGPATEPSVASPAPRQPPAASAAPQPAPRVATRYDWRRTHSPLSRSVLAELRKIGTRFSEAKPEVFAKVGDSLTASGDFLYCLGTDRVNWGEHAGLQSSWQAFRQGNAAGTDPFRRDSLAAHIGWSAWLALHGPNPPLVREVAAIRPSLALVMFGTNDIEIGKIYHYADKMFDIVDWLVERGVVPILFTIPPRRDQSDAAVEVPRYNAVVRALAQVRQVPLVDYHRELVKLPDQGLSSDGIHPSTLRGKLGRDACDFSAPGLRHGFNLRNLLALQALDRVRRALAGSLAPEPAEPRLTGAGTEREPVIVPGLPFVDGRKLHQLPKRRRGDERGDAGLAAAGPSFFYQLELKRSTRMRAMGFDRGGADVDLLLQRRSGPDYEPVKRHQRVISATLSPGTYRLVMAQLESLPATGNAEYVLVLMEE
jgi:hypothetical protein